ncbi:hypothetical protein HY417_01185 [Candidatus Kaiserbacteria bacterium]|nr:hypothetical protein [Candidatus Kaiserbacteria bacterium]
MQEAPSQDSGRDEGGDEGQEPVSEPQLTPQQVQRELQEIIVSAGIPPHTVLGTSTYLTLGHAWPRAVCIALFETLSQRTFTVSDIAQKLLPLSRFGVVINPHSIQESLKRLGGARKYAASLSAEKNWPKVGAPARERLMALARRVVAEANRSTQQSSKAAVKRLEDRPAAEFRQALSAIASRHSIVEGKIRGRKDSSTLSHGWPRALTLAVLENMAGTMPSVSQLKQIVAHMGRYDVVLEGLNLRHYIVSTGSIVDAVHELSREESWPIASRAAREDLLRLARSIAKEIDIPTAHHI